jgi:hypothetical protein
LLREIISLDKDNKKYLSEIIEILTEADWIYISDFLGNFTTVDYVSNFILSFWRMMLAKKEFLSISEYRKTFTIMNSDVSVSQSSVISFLQLLFHYSLLSHLVTF